MNIENMTIAQAREIAALFGSSQPHKNPHIGKDVIVRTYASGVHFGRLVAQHGREVELADARRIWRFDAAPHGISLSEIANHGSTGARGRICEVVPSITLLDGLEIIPTSEAASTNLRGAPVSKP